MRSIVAKIWLLAGLPSGSANAAVLGSRFICYQSEAAARSTSFRFWLQPGDGDGHFSSAWWDKWVWVLDAPRSRGGATMERCCARWPH